MQSQTPLYTKLIQFKENMPISFHVPGHKNGILLSGEEVNWGNCLKLDVTELSSLDDLHAPTGVIAEAESLLTTLHRAKKSFFLVNGSTVGNMAMIMATVKEGERVFVQRNSHKSIMNGVKLAKGKPILLRPLYDSDWGIETVLSVETLREAIRLYPEVRVLILTSPNYYGMVGELKKIIQLAHDNNIVVLVDEAHGAHFMASTYFPDSAVQLGADVVIQSAHKTLPALTMGAYLHMVSERVDQLKIASYLRMLQSSSPSYLIMASLDLARSYLGTYRKEDELYVMEQIKKFREELSAMPGISVMEYPNGQGDPLKISIQSSIGLTGFELQSILEKAGIYTELADYFQVLFVFPLLKKDSKYPFKEVMKRLHNALEPYKNTKKRKLEFKRASINLMPNIVELKLGVEEQAFYQKKKVKIHEAKNAICAETIIPYPPGIPLLLPGEEIGEEHIENMEALIRNGAKFQGDPSIYQEEIAIYDVK